MDFTFLSGWTITPDTIISLWLAWQLTKVTTNHNLRITLLEQGKKKDGK